MTTRLYPAIPTAFSVDSIAWELENDFLLFTAGKSKGQDLLITSHGGYFPFNGDFIIPPGVVLSVLGPHQHALIDPGLENMLKPSVRPYANISTNNITFGAVNRNQSPWGEPNKHPFENHMQSLKSITGTYRTGRFRNYSLQKYEGDTERNYDGIRRFINNNNFGIWTGDSTKYTMRQIDVLSVRNRPMRMAPTIKDAVKALIKKDIYYDKIILCFCRCSMSPFADFKEDYYAVT
ncbi:putative adhesin [Pseudescherichia sp.]|uniref:putative adhesin n=1 Tax=Pseudescherichia sp. TaxID=2055881 RepID=UPI00289E954E|nr:hypothetical protein [Pseudescherichia sp.]